MGKDIKKRVVEARRSYALHGDSASWRHQRLFERRLAMEWGIPMGSRGWEEPVLSQLEEGSSGYGRQRRERSNLSRTGKQRGMETAPTDTHHTPGSHSRQVFTRDGSA